MQSYETNLKNCISISLKNKPHKEEPKLDQEPVLLYFFTAVIYEFV